VARIVDLPEAEPDRTVCSGWRSFPLISCRNVMIYFDRQTQEKTVNRLSMFLEPGGHLFIGHSESLSGIRHSLTFVKPAIYRKPDARRG
jgi:chemotaxis protein methyltransferase CheR